MSMLMGTCPRCRTDVDTGISADEQTIRQLKPTLQILVRCETCNEDQTILVEDLRLQKAA
jgi:hypothetical protein